MYRYNTTPKGNQEPVGQPKSPKLFLASETVNSMTNTAVVLVADWFPGGEMAVEQ
jgi:hypothetical protein